MFDVLSLYSVFTGEEKDKTCYGLPEEEAHLNNHKANLSLWQGQRLPFMLTGCGEKLLLTPPTTSPYVE